MGSYNSIADMKNDPELREKIKASIQGVITVAEQSQNTYKRITNENSQAKQVGMNTIDTGNRPILSKGDVATILSQRGNLKSIIKTTHIAGFLQRQKTEPLVQLISTDLMNLTEEDACEKELPNWYDAKYLMELLGYQVDIAEFDFENNCIRYRIALGNQTYEEYKESVIDKYKQALLSHEMNAKYNAEYLFERTRYEKLIEERDELQARNKEIYESEIVSKITQKLSEVNNIVVSFDTEIQKAINDFTSTSMWRCYKHQYLLMVKPDSVNEAGKVADDYKLDIDPKVKAAYDNITSDPIYQSSYNDICETYNEKYRKKIDEYNNISNADIKYEDEIKKVSFITYLNLYFNNDYAGDVNAKYGSDYLDFLEKIKTFESLYTKFKKEIVLKAIYEAKGYKDKSYWDRKKFLEDYTECWEQEPWDKVDSTYTLIMNLMEQQDTAQIVYNQEYNKFKEANIDLFREVEDNNERIKEINSELSTDAATKALVYYEFWDTETIDQALLYKIRDERVKVELEYHDLSSLMNEEEQQRLKEFWTLEDKTFKAKNSITHYNIATVGNALYVEIYNEYAPEFKIEDDEEYKKHKTNLITNSVYLDTYSKMSGDLMDYQKAYITIGKIVLEANDPELSDLFMTYLNYTEDLINKNLGIDAMVYRVNNDSKWKKLREEKEDLLKSMNENYEAYKNSVNEYAELNARYIVAKREFDEKNDTKYKNSIKALARLKALNNAYSTNKLIWEEYDNVVNDTMKEMKLDDLYEILSAGFVQKISSKVDNYTAKVQNIITNISQAVSMTALNEIKTSGLFTNYTVKQKNDLEQELRFNFVALQESVSNIKNLAKTKDITSTNISQRLNEIDKPKEVEESSINILTIIIIVGAVLLGLLVIALVFKSRRPKRRVYYGGDIEYRLHMSTLKNSHQLYFNNY